MGYWGHDILDGDAPLDALGDFLHQLNESLGDLLDLNEQRELIERSLRGLEPEQLIAFYNECARVHGVEAYSAICQALMKVGYPIPMPMVEKAVAAVQKELSCPETLAQWKEPAERIRALQQFLEDIASNAQRH